MTKYICDICGKEVSRYNISGLIQVGELSIGVHRIDVCDTCKQKIKNNREIILKTICKSIKKELKRL